MTDRLNGGEEVSLFGGYATQQKLEALKKEIKEVKAKNAQLEEDNRYYKIRAKKVQGKKLSKSDASILESHERKLESRKGSISEDSYSESDGDKSSDSTREKDIHPKVKRPGSRNLHRPVEIQHHIKLRDQSYKEGSCEHPIDVLAV